MRRAANGATHVPLRRRRHRTRVEDRDIRLADVINDLVTCGHRESSHRFAVVVVGATAERANVDFHVADTAGAAPVVSTRTVVAGGFGGRQKWNELPCPSPAL